MLKAWPNLSRAPSQSGYNSRMTAFVALLRAVNVGGTGKLAMADLRSLCVAAGFAQPRTYIASGNVVFDSPLSESDVKQALEAGLAAHVGKAVGVVIRTGAEMRAVLAANPFADQPTNTTVAIFLDRPPAADAIVRISGQQDEQIALGVREIYVHYGKGMASSKLRIPAAREGTARNMNTIATLASWTSPV
jgi:uncharacterized protein (DUF1697 family)